MRMRTLETLSHTLLILTNVSLKGGLVCDGIHIQKTAMFMAVMITTVPHFKDRIVLRCSAMSAIRLMMICMSSWIWKTQKNRMKNRTGTLRRHASADSSRNWRAYYLRRPKHIIEKEPPNDADEDVDQNFTPYHVDVGRPQRTVVPSCLLDRLPYRQEAETNCEAGCERSKLKILHSGHSAIRIWPKSGEGRSSVKGILEGRGLL